MNSPDDTIQLWINAVEHPEDHPAFAEAMERLQHVRPVVYRDGRWLLEGFIASFAKEWELLRIADPSLPVSLPQHCFDVEWVARMLGLKPEDFASYDPSTKIKLNDLERDVLMVLATGPKTGRQIAYALGRDDEDGHFKSVLQGLRRRGLLGNKRPKGFFLTYKVRTDMLGTSP